MRCVHIPRIESCANECSVHLFLFGSCMRVQWMMWNAKSHTRIREIIFDFCHGKVETILFVSQTRKTDIARIRLNARETSAAAAAAGTLKWSTRKQTHKTERMNGCYMLFFLPEILLHGIPMKVKTNKSSMKVEKNQQKKTKQTKSNNIHYKRW